MFLIKLDVHRRYFAALKAEASFEERFKAAGPAGDVEVHRR